ncbi:MAG: TetR/AcrR family transcriptional regulator [Mycobacteriaceae bacterium]
MPKAVDHDARRREIVAAAYRLIARDGLEAATMRSIAKEAGYANGALARYWAGKDEIVNAVFVSVVEETNRRIAERIGGCPQLSWSRAIEAFCREVLPLSEEAKAESRAVLGFWQTAAHNANLRGTYMNNMKQWRAQLAQWFRDGQDAGQVSSRLDVYGAADTLLVALTGAQIVIPLVGFDVDTNNRGERVLADLLRNSGIRLDAP